MLLFQAVARALINKCITKYLAFGQELTFHEQTNKMGGSPGLVVMGDDSCSEGHVFESYTPYTGWTFFTLICCKRPKINEKEAGVVPFLKTNKMYLNSST